MRHIIFLGFFIFLFGCIFENIDSFEKCVDAGHPIMESFPRQCAVPGGQAFTSKEDIRKKCCFECSSAFSQSPISLPPEAVECGAFTSGRPLSEMCIEFFKTDSVMVSDCRNQ